MSHHNHLREIKVDTAVPSKADVAVKVAEFLKPLRTMTDKAGFTLLTYFLEMALEESIQEVKRQKLGQHSKTAAD